MQALIRYLLIRYGEEALGWTIRQVIERLSSDPIEPGCAPDDLAVRLSQAKKLGFDLDPDAGVYFWELPTKEQ